MRIILNHVFVKLVTYILLFATFLQSCFNYPKAIRKADTVNDNLINDLPVSYNSNTYKSLLTSKGEHIRIISSDNNDNNSPQFFAEVIETIYSLQRVRTLPVIISEEFETDLSNVHPSYVNIIKDNLNQEVVYIGKLGLKGGMESVVRGAMGNADIEHVNFHFLDGMWKADIVYKHNGNTKTAKNILVIGTTDVDIKTVTYEELGNCPAHINWTKKEDNSYKFNFIRITVTQIELANIRASIKKVKDNITSIGDLKQEIECYKKHLEECVASLNSLKETIFSSNKAITSYVTDNDELSRFIEQMTEHGKTLGKLSVAIEKLRTSLLDISESSFPFVKKYLEQGVQDFMQIKCWVDKEKADFESLILSDFVKKIGISSQHYEIKSDNDDDKGHVSSNNQGPSSSSTETSKEVNPSGDQKSFNSGDSAGSNNQGSSSSSTETSKEVNPSDDQKSFNSGDSAGSNSQGSSSSSTETSKSNGGSSSNSSSSSGSSCFKRRNGGSSSSSSPGSWWLQRRNGGSSSSSSSSSWWLQRRNGGSSSSSSSSSWWLQRRNGDSSSSSSSASGRGNNSSSKCAKILKWTLIGCGAALLGVGVFLGVKAIIASSFSFSFVLKFASSLFLGGASAAYYSNNKQGAGNLLNDCFKKRHYSSPSSYSSYSSEASNKYTNASNSSDDNKTSYEEIRKKQEKKELEKKSLLDLKELENNSLQQADIENNHRNDFRKALMNAHESLNECEYPTNLIFDYKEAVNSLGKKIQQCNDKLSSWKEAMSIWGKRLNMYSYASSQVGMGGDTLRQQQMLLSNAKAEFERLRRELSVLEDKFKGLKILHDIDDIQPPLTLDEKSFDIGNGSLADNDRSILPIEASDIINKVQNYFNGNSHGRDKAGKLLKQVEASKKKEKNSYRNSRRLFIFDNEDIGESKSGSYLLEEDMPKKRQNLDNLRSLRSKLIEELNLGKESFKDYDIDSNSSDDEAIYSREELRINKAFIYGAAKAVGQSLSGIIKGLLNPLSTVESTVALLINIPELLEGIGNYIAEFPNLSDEELAERLGSLIGKSIMQVIPLHSPVKLSTSELEKISTKARFAGREVSKAVIKGQKHHLISKKIAEAIEENTPLGKIDRNKPGLVVRAKS